MVVIGVEMEVVVMWSRHRGGGSAFAIKVEVVVVKYKSWMW